MVTGDRWVRKCRLAPAFLKVALTISDDNNNNNKYIENTSTLHKRHQEAKRDKAEIN